MKKLMKLILIFTLLNACQETPVEEKTTEKQEDLPLVVQENGRYVEWYPGRKQIKIEGREDREGKRNGVWKMYDEEGYELSITVYKHGKKHGHIIVYHPNGALYYTGEYENDERVGEWRFYNEQGELVKEENY